MKRLKNYLWLAAACAFLAACERSADVEQPRVFDRQGVGFSYPANWEIAEVSLSEGFSLVVVESPGNALAILQLMSVEDRVELNDFSRWFSQAARDNTPIVTRTEGEFRAIPAVYPVAGAALEESFAMEMFGQKIPHISRYYYLPADPQQARHGVLITQTNAEHLEKVQPGFDLILSTLTF